MIKSIKSEKIDISKNNWVIHEAKIYKKNQYESKKYLKLKTNFNLEKISKLYSNLSSLNLMGLYELRKNYKKLNYSITDIDLQILKVLTYPIYLVLMTLFSALLMFKIKKIKSTTYKISIGLFFSVIIYYFNNFSLALGETERIPLIFAVITPLFLILSTNTIMIYKINEK